jgi:hypothetical protein
MNRDFRVKLWPKAGVTLQMTLCSVVSWQNVGITKSKCLD